MNDTNILEHITRLVDEEQKLRANPGSSEESRHTLRQVEEQLDQCWDLLRQRRARREFGQDPDSAAVRDVRTVEGYEG
jgi:hypothetical protein